MSEYVDLQVNGYGGVDFSSPELTGDDVKRATDLLADQGTVAFCPTIITSSHDVYERNLTLLARYINGQLGDQMLGIHLEGPFISPIDGAIGCHPREHSKLPDIRAMQSMIDRADGAIAIVTLAPELDGAIELIKFLVENQIVVSLGHHLASTEEIELAVRAGAKASTHLGNGIPKILSRTSNPIVDQLANDQLTGMFITDGHHLPTNFIKVALRAKGLGRFIVTSDAAPIAGLEPGRYNWAGNELILHESGVIYSQTSGTLAGSASTMKMCAEVLRRECELTDDEIGMVTYSNPLNLLNARKKK
ncbi:N-acetylglucosamine-6-phosphate deacetylase [Candidatus Gracilibacteria bacterium]|nr:N-acetylglucosamine-6-phosphate deacetylase [Candidatus Gracilibacteria bacterium]